MRGVFERSFFRHFGSCPDSLNQRSLSWLVDGFLLKCRLEDISPQTISDHRRKLGRLIDYCGDCPFGDISSVMIRNYLADAQSRYNLNIVTVQRHLVSVKAIFHWASEEGFLSFNPATGVRVKLVRRIVKGLSIADLEWLLAAVQGGSSLFEARNRAIVFILVDCGLRLSELVNLELSDVEFSRGVLRITGKGSKERYVRMGLLTQQALWEYLAFRSSPGSWLWLNKANQKLDVTGVGQWLRKLGRRKGIRLYPHLLRHTFAISWLRNNGNVFALQSMLGHSSLEMTRRYCEALGFDDVYREHESASPVDNALKRGKD